MACLKDPRKIVHLKYVQEHVLLLSSKRSISNFVYYINQYSPNVKFLNYLKTLENLWFYAVFREYRNVILGEYGLSKFKHID